MKVKILNIWNIDIPYLT